MAGEETGIGFRDGAIDSARAFRAALDALARPGRVNPVPSTVPPASLSPAAGALALLLCDHTTPVWVGASIDTAELRDWLRFYTGAPLAERPAAQFAFGSWADLQPVTDFRIGTSEYPDRSATLIVEVAELGGAHRLSGPGIQGEARLTVPDPAAFRANAALFPLGLDFLLTCGDRLAAVPRTTRVEG